MLGGMKTFKMLELGQGLSSEMEGGEEGVRKDRACV